MGIDVDEMVKKSAVKDTITPAMLIIRPVSTM